MPSFQSGSSVATEGELRPVKLDTGHYIQSRDAEHPLALPQFCVKVPRTMQNTYYLHRIGVLDVEDDVIWKAAYTTSPQMLQTTVVNREWAANARKFGDSRDCCFSVL
jgi:hypothetical protein